jgi:hypothetical protein
MQQPSDALEAQRMAHTQHCKRFHMKWMRSAGRGRKLMRQKLSLTCKQTGRYSARSSSSGRWQVAVTERQQSLRPALRRTAVQLQSACRRHTCAWLLRHAQRIDQGVTHAASAISLTAG